MTQTCDIEEVDIARIRREFWQLKTSRMPYLTSVEVLERLLQGARFSVAMLGLEETKHPSLDLLVKLSMAMDGDFLDESQDQVGEMSLLLVKRIYDKELCVTKVGLA